MQENNTEVKRNYKPKRYGYIRVSRQEQNEDRQRIALEPYKIAKRNMFFDQRSGKDFKRPAYQRMLLRLNPGDILYLKSIDRLGRNYMEIIEQWRLLTREKGIDIKVLDMPLLDTTYCKDLLGTFVSDLVLQVLSFAAQLERENLLQRQAEGIAAAKAKGVAFGRPKRAVKANFEDTYHRWRRGEFSTRKAAKLSGVSMRTMYRKRLEREGVESDG